MMEKLGINKDIGEKSAQEVVIDVALNNCFRKSVTSKCYLSDKNSDLCPFYEKSIYCALTQKYIESVNLQNSLRKLMIAFRGSWINSCNELILIQKNNLYIPLSNLKTKEDLEKKVISRVGYYLAFKRHYKQDYRESSFKQEIVYKMNRFLETNYSLEEITALRENLSNEEKKVI